MIFLLNINKRHDEFSEKLVLYFQDVVSPDLKINKLDKSTRKKVDKLIRRIEREAMAYKAEVKPGVYGTARINNEIIQNLKKKGYSSEQIDLLVVPLMNTLAK